MYTLLQRAEILRETLKRVGEGGGLKPDDLALIEVILSKVTELEQEDAVQASETPFGSPMDAN